MLKNSIFSAVLFVTGLMVSAVPSGAWAFEAYHLVDADQMVLPALGKQDGLMSILYMQRAGEYKALCHQAFNVANDTLKRKIAQRARSKTLIPLKPLAVVVDVDETVLDNSPYQANIFLDPNVSYPKGWADWVNSAQAKAIPGAVDFLNNAFNNNVKVFYVTNRSDSQQAATIKNLMMEGFPNATDKTVLTMPAGTKNGKNDRRALIEKDYEIALLVGDSLADFSDEFTNQGEASRNAKVDQLKGSFGRKFIALPNAMYGDWEGALYNFNYGLPAAQKAVIRQKAATVFPVK